MLQWTQELSVGHHALDAQHEELFRRTRRIIAAADAGDPVEMTGLIDFLHAYAVTHFGMEEGLMREGRYPGYVAHKAAHDRFIGDLVALAGEYDRRGLSRTVRRRVKEFLSEWLERHVVEADRELAFFLARNRPRGHCAPGGA